MRRPCSSTSSVSTSYTFEGHGDKTAAVTGHEIQAAVPPDTRWSITSGTRVMHAGGTLPPAVIHRGR